ncbi:hypothetical protein C7999DRAFT_40142 [Corynascus novoguineensis]|uniref:NmrA-like domain-containing protein n=1 Tax=Corynascus novoguineensis TaxID=1126955 RepID=A0AAN7HQI1_9PEZI|nr:hypothetical protein C7999DRAFT_40142 [Corynascus novoguineensis]
MSPSKQQRLLWVHSTEPTGIRCRDKTTMTKIRRHIMEDIGISRRKPQRNPQFVIEIGSPPTFPNHPDVNSLLPPFWSQDPLSVLEQQWQMDTFSAYGISLLAAEGKRLLCNADAWTSEGFTFPFAFTSSAFLRHFSAIFSNSSVLKGIYHQSSGRIRVMALERSLGTISCIEATVANPSFDVATADRVISAVLSVICYNLLNLEFDQARVHLDGLGGLIAARGGIQSLKGNNELRLMIFWPRYPLPVDLTPVIIHTDPSKSLPMPLSRILATAETEVGVQLTHIPVCVAGLSELAITIESELAVRGNALWNDEIFLGLRINPLAHRLFDRTGRTTRFSPHLDQTLESIRLGVIVWIIWAKRMCRSWPGSPMAYVPELLDMLSVESSWAPNIASGASDDILSVRLWLSVLCSIASRHGSCERETAVRLIAEDMHRLNRKEWGDVMVQTIHLLRWSFSTSSLRDSDYALRYPSSDILHPSILNSILTPSESHRRPWSHGTPRRWRCSGVAQVPITLRKAFTGAYGVFAITSESHPDKKIATSGQFPKLYHMNNKHAVEKIAREELPGRVTCLIPGFFYTNLLWRQYCRRQGIPKICFYRRFCYPIPSDQVVQWTDPDHDMGAFAAKVFNLGVDRTRGKTYLVMTPPVTPQEMAETFTRVTGQPAIHSPTSVEEFGDMTAKFVGPPFKEDAKQMMQWAAITPKSKVAYGALDPHVDRSAEELGLTATSFEAWLKRSGWRGPDRE